MNKYFVLHITLVFKFLFIYIAKNYLHFSKLSDTINFFLKMNYKQNTTELCLSKKNPLDSIFEKISFHI